MEPNNETQTTDNQMASITKSKLIEGTQEIIKPESKYIGILISLIPLLLIYASYYIFTNDRTSPIKLLLLTPLDILMLIILSLSLEEHKIYKNYLLVGIIECIIALLLLWI